jgi:hypothetical protein
MGGATDGPAAMGNAGRDLDHLGRVVFPQKELDQLA